VNFQKSQHLGFFDSLGRNLHNEKMSGGVGCHQQPTPQVTLLEGLAGLVFLSLFLRSKRARCPVEGLGMWLPR
jgi:hypothetical protein